MILFEKDFAEQGAIVDYSTKNLSFVRYTVLLKRMGISNHLWPLALYQQELQNVDPYAKDLSNDIKLKIAIECKINPWYAFREIIRVPMAGADSGPYIANRANMALMWCYMNNLATFLTIPRQIGKTIAIMSLVAWLMYIAAKSINIGLFAKGNSLILENVSRLKIIRDNFPEYLINKSSDDTNNKEGIDYKALNNKYLTFAAQADKRAAEGQARGESLAVEHWDEMAYYTNNNLSYPSAISASDTASEQTRATGVPAANIITTTAGDLNDPSGEYANNIKTNAFRFREKLFDCKNYDELHIVLSSNSTNHIFYLEYSYKQLGKTEEWFQAVTRGKPKDKIAKDYLNQWYAGSEGGFLPKHIVDRLIEEVKDPLHCQIFETLMIKWFVEPHVLSDPLFKTRPFIIGGDTSDNVGRDFTTIVMLDPSDMSVVCTCRCNVSNLIHVANCLVKLMEDFTRAILIPERNKNGAMLIDLIITALAGKGINVLPRIYNTIYQNKDSEDIDIRKLDISSPTVRKSFGFTTTKSESSRTLLYKNVLMTTLDLNIDKIYDQDLIDEMIGLVIKNGRIDHKDGSHDDTLIAYLLCCFFVFYGKNLDLYGIDRSEFLNQMATKDNGVAPDIKNQQITYIKRIKEIEEILDNETLHPMTKHAYAHELRHLKSLIRSDIVSDEMIAVEQVKQKQKEEVKSIFSFSPTTSQSILSRFF